MYVIARQLWSRYYPASRCRRTIETGRRQTIAAVLRAVGQEHGQPEDLDRGRAGHRGRIKQFIARAAASCGCPTRTAAR